MTVPLYYRDATDAESFVIAWLSPLNATTTPPGGADVVRATNDPLPFRIVTEITSTEKELISAFPVVSIHTLASTQQQLTAEAAKTHERMLVLVNDPLTEITLPDSSVVTCEWAETVERPHREYYSDLILQKVARYRLGIPFINVVGS